MQVSWCWHLFLRVLSSLRAGFVAVISNGMDVNLLNDNSLFEIPISLKPIFLNMKFNLDNTNLPLLITNSC